MATRLILVGATACCPDGAFSLQPNDYDYWDASGFFQVTLGFGAMTFSEAKALDVVWDVVSASVYVKRARTHRTDKDL
jgi:hypothetical protein